MQQTTTTPTILFVGASGSSWEFNIYGKDTTWYHVPCVYAVTKVATDGKTYVLYVGETKDIAERFSGHHKEPCFNSNGWTHVCTLGEPNEITRRQIEADLIRKYTPVCND